MKKIILTVTLAVSALLVARAQTADYRIIPLPKSVVTDTTHVFTLTTGMGIAYDSSDAEVARIASFLRDWVEEVTSVRLTLTPDDKWAAIRLTSSRPSPKRKASPKSSPKGKDSKSPLLQQGTGETEAYTLTVDAKGIALVAEKPVGLFRGAQTLRKALPVVNGQSDGTTVTLPYVCIDDEPRFDYRGAHLDTSRHFFTIDFLKKYLDVLALHGCNQFHWHLTDNQGWRFEVKALPELAAKGSIRAQSHIGRAGLYDGTPYGGYYTQDDCRELVRYAAERYINIIPEIDMPAHIESALSVYPELGCTGGPYRVVEHLGGSSEVLCAGNPKTMEFLRTVFGELCDVFPSKMIHIGGDECPKSRWRSCPKCQAKIRELGLTDDGHHSVENQLQSWMNHEIETFLHERGRDIIGWDEVLEGGLTEGGIVMSWRGIDGGIEAAQQGHRVIMTPTDYCYFDYWQLRDHDRQPVSIGYYLPVSKTYSFEPFDDERLGDYEKKYILGVQGNLWTEYVAYPMHVFYMLLPRLDALSEVQWCLPDQKDYDDFRARLPRIRQLYDRLGVNYCRDME